METVSTEMKHFFAACDILVHEMSPRDFSKTECKLLQEYCLELYVRYGRCDGQPRLNQVDSQSSTE